MDTIDKKRKVELDNSADDQSRKRSSRFSETPVDGAAATAQEKALQIAKQLQLDSSANQTALSSFSVEISHIQNEIAQQIASVTSLLQSTNQSGEPGERKAVYRPLLLDSQGREIDTRGLVVKSSGPIKTLVANVAVSQAQKKKENPYLQHTKPPNLSEEVVKDLSYDDRVRVANRETRSKKALNFVDAGTYLKQADIIRAKEERKLIAGYLSGRKAPEIVADEEDAVVESSKILSKPPEGENIPPPTDDNIVPSMEWWDESFLPKDIRESRRRSLVQSSNDDYEKLLLQNSKTFKYIQHPIPVKALGGEKSEEPLPMYLTKKERKRIRRKMREERELEKRDMQMMGLIQPPEPKFKLSNFMKVLGDQAVADPSKVEQKVMQQVKERELKHEMRNQAAKLTPAERKEKLRKKYTEVTTRQVSVALFRVRDFSSSKHRFKVDVNAQQFNLTGLVVILSSSAYRLIAISYYLGTVLICPTANANLVLAEGGPKGIKKFIRLMLHRIPWDTPSEDSIKSAIDVAEAEQDVDGSEGDLQSASKSINRCDLLWQGVLPRRSFHAFRFQVRSTHLSSKDFKKRCLFFRLISFQNYFLQECRTSKAARKVLEAKGIANYWDMVTRADEILHVQTLL